MINKKQRKNPSVFTSLLPISLSNSCWATVEEQASLSHECCHGWSIALARSKASHFDAWSESAALRRGTRPKIGSHTPSKSGDPRDMTYSLRHRNTWDSIILHRASIRCGPQTCQSTSSNSLLQTAMDAEVTNAYAVVMSHWNAFSASVLEV